MWAEAVAFARAHRREATLPAGLVRLSGGFNNEVFAIGDTCVKLYRVDERRRWEREWRALRFVAERDGDLAPRPLWYEPQGSPPAVVMSMLSGEPLSERPIGPRELSALGDMVLATHSLPEGAAYPTTVIGTPARCVGEIELTVARLTTCDDDPLARESLRCLRPWLHSDDPAALLRPAPPAFSRGDANLGNCLWDGQRMRAVDFEYAGTIDVSFDLANLVEAETSHRVSDEAWRPILNRFAMDAQERARFRAARRLMARFWLTIFWRAHLGRPEARIAAQMRRVAAVDGWTR